MLLCKLVGRGHLLQLRLRCHKSNESQAAIWRNCRHQRHAHQQRRNHSSPSRNSRSTAGSRQVGALHPGHGHDAVHRSVGRNLVVRHPGYVAQCSLLSLSLVHFNLGSEADLCVSSVFSGIHGVPFEPWGGVEFTAGNFQSGFCTHESILFPTWHRAYMALYEVCP